MKSDPDYRLTLHPAPGEPPAPVRLRHLQVKEQMSHDRCPMYSGSAGAANTAPTLPQHTLTKEGPVMASADSTAECRDVPGFPGYRVGSDGSVWSCILRIPVGGARGGFRSTLGQQWKEIKARPNGDGYRVVNLYRDRRACTRRVCLLVLQAFVGVRPQGKQACHNDGNSSNDRVENLRWGTPQENEADKLLHGTKARGTRHGSAKLTDDDVRAIRRLHQDGLGLTAIATSFGVLKNTVGDIVKRKIWAWLE